MVQPTTISNINNNYIMDMNLDKDNYLSRDHYCTQCNRSFTRVRDRIRHENSVHIRQERFGCSHCGKTFTRRDSKVRHEHQCLKFNTNDNTKLTDTLIKLQQQQQQEQEQEQEQHYNHQRILSSPSPPLPGTSIPLSKSQPNKPLHMNPDPDDEPRPVRINPDLDDGPIELPPILIDKKQQKQLYDNKFNV